MYINAIHDDEWCFILLIYLNDNSGLLFCGCLIIYNKIILINVMKIMMGVMIYE